MISWVMLHILPSVESSVAIILLGLLHGLMPTMGWLFGVYYALHEGDARYIPTSIGALSGGHILADALPIFVIAGLLKWVAVPWLAVGFLIGVAILILGGYNLYKVMREKHSFFGHSLSYPRLFIWGFLLGESNGSGASLLPFIDLFSSIVDLSTIVLLHYISLLSSMLVVSFFVYKVLGVAVIQKAWINFHLLWTVILLLIGSLQIGVVILQFYGIQVFGAHLPF